MKKQGLSTFAVILIALLAGLTGAFIVDFVCLKAVERIGGQKSWGVFRFKKK